MYFLIQYKYRYCIHLSGNNSYAADKPTKRVQNVKYFTLTELQIVVNCFIEI